MKSIKLLLHKVNQRIYNGEDLDEDRECLEYCLVHLKDRAWFDKCYDCGDDWICQEGTMAPGFLHLEDDKTSLCLEELLINGHVTKNDVDILEEIHQFYSNLYSHQNAQDVSQVE